ncbi:MAG: hypothetical protein J7513_15685 [Solirubrobacteraceae bacterium]|nr:hypothetical protein [Solirubrobacteraceae bacterium]
MTTVLSDGAVRALSGACALDLTMFRRSHVEGRVHRALALEQVDAIDELRARLASDDRSRDAFRRSVAISVTRLFRDPEQFEVLARALRTHPLPPRPVRAWSAGCATGEEAWSIAATLAKIGRADGARILGSDLMPENVRIARTLAPAADQLGGAPLPDSLRMRFEVRDLVNQGVPGGGWDLVLCRNVAIYLAADQRRELHLALAGSIRLGGFLMLGRSERLHEPTALGVERVAPHLYRRVR